MRRGRWASKVLVGALVTALVSPGVATTAAASGDDDPVGAPDAAMVPDDAEIVSPYLRRWRNPDGSWSLESFAGRRFFRDVLGVWREIDARLVAEQLFFSADIAIVATGDRWPDAVSGSRLARLDGAGIPILLGPANASLHATTAAYLYDADIRDAYQLGLTVAVGIDAHDTFERGLRRSEAVRAGESSAGFELRALDDGDRVTRDRFRIDVEPPDGFTVSDGPATGWVADDEPVWSRPTPACRTPPRPEGRRDSTQGRP